MTLVLFKLFMAKDHAQALLCITQQRETKNPSRSLAFVRALGDSLNENIIRKLFEQNARKNATYSAHIHSFLCLIDRRTLNNLG